MNRWKIIARRAVIGFLAVFALGIVILLVIARTPWLEELVRAKIVEEIEDITGRTPETGDITIDIFRLSARIDDFVLRGTEPAARPPFFSAQYVEFRLELGAFLRGEYRLPFLTMQRPVVNIYVDEAGRNNIPDFPGVGDEPFLETLVNLEIGTLTARQGVVNYLSAAIPLDIRAQGLNLNLNYVPAKPGYEGAVNVSNIELDSPTIEPVAFEGRSDLDITRQRLAFQQGRLTAQDSLVQFTGNISRFDPFRGVFDIDANLAMAQVAPLIPLTVEPRGNIRLAGRLDLGGEPFFAFTGSATGEGLETRTERFNLGVFSFQTDIRTEGRALLLPNLTLTALGGTFTGQVRLVEFNEFTVRGTVQGFELQELSRRLAVVPDLAWSGRLTGDLFIQGRLRADPAPAARGTARFEITPTPGPIPLEGFVNLTFDQVAGTVGFADSVLRTADSTLEFAGTLPGALNISFESANLDDLVPAIALVTGEAPDRLPITLVDGLAAFDGTVTGTLADPVLAGRAEIQNFAVDGRRFDSYSSEVRARATALSLEDVRVAAGEAEITGRLTVGLVNWAVTDASALAAVFNIEDGDVEMLLAQAGEQAPLAGTLDATILVAGTVGNPVATADIAIARPVIAGQPFDTLTAQLEYEGNTLRVLEAEAVADGSRLALDATYVHAPRDWRSGNLVFAATAAGVQLGELYPVRHQAPGLAGTIEGQAAGALRLSNLRPEEITALEGEVVLSAVSLDNRPLGAAFLTARSENGLLRLQTAADLRGTSVQGRGLFQLAGNAPGEAYLQIGRLDLETAAELVALRRPTQWPIAGFLTGEAVIRGPLLAPERLAAEIRLDQIQVEPRDPALRLTAGPAGAIVRNLGPVLLTVNRDGLLVRRAQFVGDGTDFVVAGGLGFRTPSPWDLRIVGTVNLAIAQAFSPNIVSSGLLVLNAVVRGTLREPELGGQAQVINASLYHANFATGLTEAYGTIAFNQDRATIERLTAQVGGGAVDFSGQIGFVQDRLQFGLRADARGVRVRYPRDVGTTFNANLSLTGTSDRSLLTGLVEVQRVVIAPQTDLGGLITAISDPVATPVAPSPILQAMSLNVDIETAPTAELISALADRLEATADLRLRGTAANPSLLGEIEISEGQIQFFGTTYTITRAEIGFFNPARIEPVLDFNVETTTRGIVVAVTFAGPLDRLQITYRSDPPLETTDIVALLALGRDPIAFDPAVAQTASSAALLQAGAVNLLGQALADPITSRLQRVFGLRRLQIDPALVGFDTIPQARLTIEQQLSRDIILTYITDLTDARSQIIRLQWDFSPRFSVTAVRDADGYFGIDFLFRRTY